MGVKHKYAHHGILCGGQRATCGAGPFLCLYIGSGDRTWVFGFVCQAFCLLSHLTSSHTRWFFSFHPPGAPSIPHHTLANCLVSPPNRHHTMRVPLLATRRSYNVHQLESCPGSNKSVWHTLRPWECSHRYGQSSVASSGVTAIYFVWFSFHQVMPFTLTILALSWNLTNSLSSNPHSITRRRILFWNLLRAL